MKIDYRHEFRFKVRFEMIPACRIEYSTAGVYIPKIETIFFFLLLRSGENSFDCAAFI